MAFSRHVRQFKKLNKHHDLIVSLYWDPTIKQDTLSTRLYEKTGIKCGIGVVLSYLVQAGERLRTRKEALDRTRLFRKRYDIQCRFCNLIFKRLSNQRTFCCDKLSCQNLLHRMKIYEPMGMTYEWFLANCHECMICKKLLLSSKECHIDHDHVTNQIRGILCYTCNSGIGVFKNDPLLLQQAIDYLMKDNHALQKG